MSVSSALAFDDGRVRESAGAVWGGKIGDGRLLLGASVQGRHNPKSARPRCAMTMLAKT